MNLRSIYDDFSWALDNHATVRFKFADIQALVTSRFAAAIGSHQFGTVEGIASELMRLPGRIGGDVRPVTI